MPVVQFVETEYRVTEGVGDVDVCLRIDGRISNPVVVRLFPSPDTAEGRRYAKCQMAVCICVCTTVNCKISLL